MTRRSSPLGRVRIAAAGSGITSTVTGARIDALADLTIEAGKNARPNLQDHLGSTSHGVINSPPRTNELVGFCVVMALVDEKTAVLADGDEIAIRIGEYRERLLEWSAAECGFVVGHAGQLGHEA